MPLWSLASLLQFSMPLGITQHQGYLAELGLQETQFPLSPDRVFFQGFLSLAQMNAEAVNYQAIAAAVCATLSVLLFMFGGWLYRYKPKPKKRSVTDIIIHGAETKKHHKAGECPSGLPAGLVRALAPANTVFMGHFGEERTRRMAASIPLPTICNWAMVRVYE